MKVKKLSKTECSAAAVPEQFKADGIEYSEIGVGNWAEQFPYHPEVKFAIAHDDKNIYIHYQVKENSVRAVEGLDLGHVWEDSCCEFFVSPDEKSGYYNLEANCIGTILLCNGQEREGRTPAPNAVLTRIERWASLGERTFGIRNEDTAWELALKVPVTAFFRNKITTLSGLKMRGNFYKCGDKTQAPHFLSWKKVDVPQPDFHRPEFFGDIEFE